MVKLLLKFSRAWMYQTWLPLVALLTSTLTLPQISWHPRRILILSVALYSSNWSPCHWCAREAEPSRKNNKDLKTFWVSKDLSTKMAISCFIVTYRSTWRSSSATEICCLKVTMKHNNQIFENIFIHALMIATTVKIFKLSNKNHWWVSSISSNGVSEVPYMSLK